MRRTGTFGVVVRAVVTVAVSVGLAGGAAAAGMGATAHAVVTVQP